MKQFSILVTGGAGYIGSILVPALLKRDYKVTVLDSLMYRQNTLLECCNDKGFDFVKADIRDDQIVSDLIPKFDAVILLAYVVGAPACKASPTTSWQVNYDAHANIMTKISSSQMLIFPTTNSGYGVGEKSEYCTEDSPLRPVSDYGRAKVEIEKMVLEKRAAISFRLATVFGMSPRMRMDLLVNDFTYRAFKDRSIILFEESFRRNFIHIRDVAGAFLFGIDNYDRMAGEPFNVGLSTANLTKRELCEKIKTHMPDFHIHAAPIGEDPDKRDYVVSNAKLESLGWVPGYTLDAGIVELLKGYKILGTSRFCNA